MPIRFRLLTETDVRAVLSMDDLIETMASALGQFSAGRVAQPVRTVIPVRIPGTGGVGSGMTAAPQSDAREAGLFALMPAHAGESAALGAKLVTVFGGNRAFGLDSHLASILLLDQETGALRALLDGRYITEARTAAVSAVSSRLLARPSASSLAIIGSGVQARSHLDALSRVHRLKSVSVWSPNQERRERFVAEVTADHAAAVAAPSMTALDHPGEAVVGADVIVLATSSKTPVIENGWVKPGAHVISVGAVRPTEREMDPALTARARFFADSREAALVESGDMVLGIKEGRFTSSHIVAEIGQLVNGEAGRTNDTEVTIFKSLGLAVEDVTAANLALQRAIERGIGTELTL
jgi:alanine dehydrogenase